MNNILRTVTLGALIVSAGTAMAEADHRHLAMNHAGSTTRPADAAAAMSEGTIRKIDKAAGKVTIKHGQLANLNMPPMTMAFRVKDPAVLDRIKVGDQVGFVAESIDGVLTVTEIRPAK